MKKSIPKHIDPYRSSDQSISFFGMLATTDMQRLRALNMSVLDEPEVELHFKRDEGGIAVVTGKLSLTLQLHCQRCMDDYSHRIETQFALGVVDTMKEADVLPKSYEPVFTTDRELIISDLIEDEVLLALPIIPKHPIEQCKIKNRSVMSNADSSLEQCDNDRSHPFNRLKVLKNKQ